ncbi:sulfite exporter TauE/SafE family protein [Sphingobium sp.]|uniref:sulfite exporter TauE/SafE family protein n=1 Tax=Sphingobium sp. TaxID=1912891 RepID=UPI002C966157|nr:sulfite exporter TauE/SafE family protein [Sphingobium sp.]HUD92475.1 sulfite exporter TauE/SafE family protein [Sphingobium sp.]
MILTLLLTALGITAIIYMVALMRGLAAQALRRPRIEAVILGAVTNFFDTLGIGSFAPTMAWLKFRRLAPDRLIPPTLLAGHALPTIVQSAIFLALLGVEVDPLLLLGCIIAMVLGGFLGVPLAERAPVRVVQIIVALALLIAAGFYTATNLALMPGGGQASTLPLTLTLLAIALQLVLGILQNFGVGAYAPTLVALSLFGMDPRYAFPIMTSAVAFSISASAIRRVRSRDLDLRFATGMAIGGVPAVLIAAFLVRSMPILILRWLVVAVVLYAALILIRSAVTPKRQPPSEI